jgi:stage V sporulation protein S
MFSKYGEHGGNGQERPRRPSNPCEVATASSGEEHEVLKVSSRSNPNSVAGAMAGVVRQAGVVEVQIVGAGALNQAIKAMAIARGFVAPSGIDLVCVPTFADIEIDGERRTAIRLCISDRGRHIPELPLVAVGANGANGHRAIDLRD